MTLVSPHIVYEMDPVQALWSLKSRIYELSASRKRRVSRQHAQVKTNKHANKQTSYHLPDKNTTTIPVSHHSCLAALTSFIRHFGVFPCDNAYAETNKQTRI